MDKGNQSKVSGRKGANSGGRGGRGQGGRGGRGKSSQGNDMKKTEPLPNSTGDTVFNGGGSRRDSRDGGGNRHSPYHRGSRGDHRNSGHKNSPVPKIALADVPDTYSAPLAQALLDLWPEHVWKDKYASRPGKKLCMHFSRTGMCGMPTCRFDHPPRGKDVDDALVDSAEASGDAVLFDVYVLAFALIRAVTSFTMSDAERGFYSTGLFEATLSNLEEGCETLLSREWHTERSISNYGIMMTFFQVVMPRAMEKLSYFFKSILLIAETYAGYLGQDIDTRYSIIRQKILAYEENVVIQVKNQAPLLYGIKADNIDDTEETIKTRTALTLHRALMTNCRDAVGSMAQCAGLRDRVLIELREILLPYFKKKTFELLRCNGKKDTKDLNLDEFFSFQIELRAFGSSANTIGTMKSDLDITIEPYMSEKNEDHKLSDLAIEDSILWMENPKKVLEAAKKALGYMDDDDLSEDDDSGNDDIIDEKDAKKVFILREYVSGARVPVLKLTHAETGLDIDLIEYSSNEMAHLNTQLLRDYASSDSRVRPLMYAIKRWASARGVSDSRNGTLSTYCWMILVIFFLQTTCEVAADDNDDETSDTAEINISLKELELADDSITEKISPPKLNIRNLQGKDAFRNETYKISDKSTDLSTIYGNIPAISDVDPVHDQSDIVRLLLNFFVFYATEGIDSFGSFSSIASIRIATSSPKHGTNRANDLANFATSRCNTAAMNAKKEVENPTVSSVSNNVDSLTRYLCAWNLKTRHETFPFLDTYWNPAEKSPKTLVIDSMTTWRVSVEDPFELEHDLGSVIRSPAGQSFILTELRRAMGILYKSLILGRNDSKSDDDKVTDTTDLFDKLCEVNNSPSLSDLCFICFSTEHTYMTCRRFVCYQCEQQGHWTKECPNEKKKKKYTRKKK
jgi:hypothetical protein